MNVSSAKENILKKIRKALTQSTPLPFPQSEGSSSVYQPLNQDLDVEFAEQFTNLQGRFVFCLDYEEAALQLKAIATANKWTKIFCKETDLAASLSAAGFDSAGATELESCDAAVTSCEFLVARTGSIVLSSAQQSGRTVSVYAPVHICIATTDQLVYEVREGLVKMKEKYAGNLPSMFTFASGPSRTADIEKTLVVGVHGPKEVFVILIDQPAV
ncbi:MAG: lactate utilization protein B/C [Chitinophagaceae bacterium]|nr:MAG: lactate utilization protein B/C [Chitinophagaceae bacterium]